MEPTAQAAEKLRILIAKKRGTLPASTGSGDTCGRRWELSPRVQKLPALVDGSLATRATQPDNAVHAAATGQALPGRKVPHSIPLANSPFLVSLLAGLPERSQGQLRIVDGIPVWAQDGDRLPESGRRATLMCGSAWTCSAHAIENDACYNSASNRCCSIQLK
jgi:hypothetical protein